MEGTYLFREVCENSLYVNPTKYPQKHFTFIYCIITSSKKTKAMRSFWTNKQFVFTSILRTLKLQGQLGGRGSTVGGSCLPVDPPLQIIIRMSPQMQFNICQFWTKVQDEHKKERKLVVQVQRPQKKRYSILF